MGWGARRGVAADNRIFSELTTCMTRLPPALMAGYIMWVHPEGGMGTGGDRTSWEMGKAGRAKVRPWGAGGMAILPK